MTMENLASITEGCAAAIEAARRAEEAAASAQQILQETASQVEHEPSQRGTIQANAARAITALARAAERDAKLARELADAAAAAVRRRGSRVGEVTAPLSHEVAEAQAAADRAAAAAEAAETARKEAIAQFAVEEELQVQEFFQAHREQIFRKLEECDQIAENAPINGDMIFIAESLPLINSIIHVGSDRATLARASNWVRETWGDEADPLIVLSALLFIYVANKGAEEKGNDETWKRIHERVEKLM
jgi:hypothetical protein